MEGRARLLLRPVRGCAGARLLVACLARYPISWPVSHARTGQGSVRTAREGENVMNCWAIHRQYHFLGHCYVKRDSAGTWSAWRLFPVAELIGRYPTLTQAKAAVEML